MRYLIYNIDKHQQDCQLAEHPSSTDFRDADDCFSVVVDLEQGQRYYGGEWKPCSVRREPGPPDEVRGWLEKGSTWQARAIHAEKRLAEAYARMRYLDEQLTKLKMDAEKVST